MSERDLSVASIVLSPQRLKLNGPGRARTPETIAARFAEISHPATAAPLRDAFGQMMKFVAAAAKAKGVKLE